MSLSTTYDPFARGLHPVGVRSGTLVDTQRANRPLPFELWYPATPRYAGQDLNPETQNTFTVTPDSPPLRQAAVRDAAAELGSYPLVLFSHTSAGHRRQSSFLCTHLASHGYIVAAVDHTGNTAADLAERTLRAAAGETMTPEQREAYLQQIIADRVPDLRCLLDAALAGPAGATGDTARYVDDQRVGVIGWSFGGWAALATPEVDTRFGAIVALAPAGNSQPVPGIIPAELTFAWHREVPTLFLVAERDRFTPLPGQYELLERTPSHKQMFILLGADHGHFGDQIDPPGDCPPHHAQSFTRALALVHLDAVMKGDPAARHFLANDPIAALRAHGVDAATHPADGAE